MKKILFALLLSLPAFGGDAAPGSSAFDFTFFGNTSGRFTMVSCDYAEYVVTAWMEKFGAKNLDTFCTGGIQPYGTIGPLSLRIRFTPPDQTGATTTQTFKIESGPYSGDTNCDFDTELMRSLAPAFPNVRFTKKTEFCFTSESPYSFEGTITLRDLPR